MSAWLAAGVVLCAGVLACAAACARGAVAAAVAALQVAGAVASVALVVLSVAFSRQPFADLGLVTAVMSFAGSLAFLRYLERG